MVNINRILGLAIFAGVGIVIVNSLRRKSSPIKEAKKVVKAVVELPKKLVSKTILDLDNNPKKSLESKDNPKKKSKKAKAGKKGGDATAKLGKHKGHRTKKGLSQDQKLDSKEDWEKQYRKTKSKKVKI